RIGRSFAGSGRRGHPPPAIDQQEQLLTALLLILTHDRTAALRERFPIDRAHVVSVHVLAQRLELRLAAAAAQLAHAEIAPTLARRERERARKIRERRLDRDRLPPRAACLPPHE